MRLADLKPQWLHIDNPKSFRHVDAIAEADGIFFLCPKCSEERPAGVGVHGVICWRPRVGQEIEPTPGRWEFEGTGYGDLTLVAGSSSVLLTGPGCQAHFFIRAGEIVMA